ncbi:hypothetical protein [Pedobacter miscanthi]|uniref:Lipoprotein n=1 Tax=Pedobacter miscanthi TaxID=2259170 RepID=A0A366L135_9SPHI|nr:hypothetical protein [Pedobacter miscanthi]RBQ07578.1 hypothetical protein DRW42_10335 [Pedobacter miscanthi]
MKNAVKTTTILLIACTTFFACKKKTEDPMDFTVDDQNLTACPLGTTCHFQYADNASMDENWLNITAGQHRIFWARNVKDSRTSWMYFQAPMTGDRFLLNDADVQAGKVKFVSSCPVCYGVELRALKGTVKGIKVVKNSAEPEKWLLESNIVLSVIGSIVPVDTIYVKQYYTPAIQ